MMLVHDLQCSEILREQLLYHLCKEAVSFPLMRMADVWLLMKSAAQEMKLAR